MIEFRNTPHHCAAPLSERGWLPHHGGRCRAIPSRRGVPRSGGVCFEV
ncbi:MAG: hypothetical protein IKQ53_00840 [Bacteroidales bacterium]|nr:hypothetical protein [Bacteroidales bacterium]